MCFKWLMLTKIAKSVKIEHLSDSMLGFPNTEQSAQQIFIKLNSVYEWKNVYTLTEEETLNENNTTTAFVKTRLNCAILKLGHSKLIKNHKQHILIIATLKINLILKIEIITN